MFPTTASNMRARRGRVIGVTSTKRTSVAKRRRRPVKMVPRRERSRMPRSNPGPTVSRQEELTAFEPAWHW